jgi:signal transduction histidine kinase
MIAFAVLWIAAFILILTDPKREVLRWGSGIAFFSGCGYLAVVIRSNVLPSLVSNNDKNMCLLIIGILFSFSMQVAPYCVFVFSIIYSGVFGTKWAAWRYRVIILLFIPVIVSYLIVPMYPYYASKPPESYKNYIILTIWALPYIILSSCLLFYSFMTESKVKIKRQRFLTFIVLAPTTLYAVFVSYVFRIFNNNNLWNYTAWIVVPLFFVFLILGAKYGALGYRLKYEKHYIPVERILDNISDSYIILDESLDIIEVNKTFTSKFGEIKKDDNFLNILSLNNTLKNFKDKIIQSIMNSKELKKMDIFEVEILNNDDEMYLLFEITPIFLHKKFIASIVLVKDITEHKKILSLIKQNQNQLIEKEKLLGLNELIGGIAHNLKTPIFSCSGGIDIIAKKIQKIDELIYGSDIDKELKERYENELSREIIKWKDRIKEYLLYMGNIISITEKQIISSSNVTNAEFKIKDVTNQLNTLIGEELKEANCSLKFNMTCDENIRIKGHIYDIIQIVINLINNAKDSYENKGGIINLTVSQEGAHKINITVQDYGKGIPDNIKTGLFKKMVTTKGKSGTGLGLYISKAILTSKFNGEINFESEEGKGSTFKIIIPARED